MNWLESIVVRLSQRVDRQLDDLTDKKDFDLATDAYTAGDYARALSGYSALAERGHGRAAALAGEMYLSGTGTKKSGPLALKYFQLGSAAGDPDASALLGMAYASGMPGVKVDYIKARPLLETAVKNGDKKALAMLEIVKSRQRGKRR